MIDIVDIKGKKVVFIDEISFGFPLDIRERKTNDWTEDEERNPVFYTHFSFQKQEKLGERIAYVF